MVMMTLGTGVGGGVVIDGRLWRGQFDNAGEIGHMISVPGGRACPCGQAGCFERYASANAVAERLAEAVRGGEDSALKPKVEAGEAFDARDVLGARLQGDALAARIWDETCLHLAVAVVNMQHIINPELVVFAGGLSKAGDTLLEPVREHFDRLVWKLAPDQPQIALATLGAEAGTIGAAALAIA
jgi:glucokinase